jgi:hypothetical protein
MLPFNYFKIVAHSILCIFIFITLAIFEIDAQKSSTPSISSNQTDFCSENGSSCENSTKLSSSNKVNLTALGLEDEIDGQSIGIDIQQLGNLTELEEILTNDTGVGQLANASFLDDRK